MTEQSDQIMNQGLAAIESGVASATGAPANGGKAPATPSGVAPIGTAQGNSQPYGQAGGGQTQLPPIPGSQFLAQDNDGDIPGVEPSKPAPTTSDPEPAGAPPAPAAPAAPGSPEPPKLQTMATDALLSYIRENPGADSDIIKELDSRGLRQDLFTRKMQDLAAQPQGNPGTGVAAPQPPAPPTPEPGIPNVQVPEGVDPEQFQMTVKAVAQQVLGPLADRMEGLENVQAARSIQAEESAALDNLKTLGMVDKSLTEGYWRETFKQEYRDMAKRGEAEVPVDVLVGRIMLQPKHRQMYETKLIAAYQAKNAQGQKQTSAVPDLGSRSAAPQGPTPMPMPATIDQAEAMITQEVIRRMNGG